MPSLREQAGNAAREAVEFVACTTDAVLAFADRLPFVDIPGGLWPQLCPSEPPPPEVFPPAPPFEGGQCEGVTYLVTYEYDEITTFSPRRTVTPPQSPFPVLGPFSGLEMQSPRVIQGEEGFARIVAKAGNGDFTINQFASNTAVLEVRVLSVDRQDGLPDECGSPPAPPRPRPPLPIPPPTDRPVTDPDGGPDIDFTFAPSFGPIFVDIDGSLKIPVNVNVNGPNIFAPVNVPVNISLPDFNVDFNIGGGNGTGEPGPPSVPCCDPPRVPGEDRPGGQNEPVATEPPPQGSRLTGVRVQSSVNQSLTTATRIDTPSDAPPLWVPRIGSVIFEVQIETEGGGTVLSYSRDYDVKLDNQYIPAPSDVTVVRAIVEPGKGVEATITPLFIQAK